MKQQNKTIVRSIKVFEKIESQYRDIKDGDVKRVTEVLTEALDVVEQCIQVLGSNHPDTIELYYMIGSMYRDLKEYPQSVIWFSKGVEQGDDSCECELALIYQCGKGVKQDLDKAIDLYTQAAVKGNETAILELGLIYENADGVEGVEADYAKAAEWYIKLATKGDEFASIQLARCLHMIGENKKALAWAQRNAKNNSNDNYVIFTLASIYQALGDKEKALKNFELCLMLEEEQEVSDEIKSETRKKIRELNPKFTSFTLFLKKLPFKFDIRIILLILLLTWIICEKTDSWTDVFVILLKVSIGVVAFGAMMNQDLSFSAKLGEYKLMFWKIPWKLWKKFIWVNIVTWGIFIIICPLEFLIVLCILLFIFNIITLIATAILAYKYS